MAQYSAFIKEYIELNHKSSVEGDCLSNCKYFLPHHCIIKEDSTTTKLRVVFDGSAASSSGYSLNDILMAGPTIQPKLFTTLLRFRLFPIALTGDICKMYRCVRIHPPDSYLQCILWRDSESQEVKVYRLDTVTYSTKPASFLSIRVMHQLAMDEQSSYSTGSQVLQRDFYVDDLITGGNSVEEVLEIMQQTSNILAKGKFKLRKWCSNHSAVLKGVPNEDKEPFLKFEDGSSVTKTLGLVWDPTVDNFLFSFSPVKASSKPCKRYVPSTIARFYDPLGLIGPVLTKVKIFLQTLWKEKLAWDESLPAPLYSEWHRLYSDIRNVQLSIYPRFALQQDSTIEVHGFCDASIEAYGACIYVRSSKGERVTTHLLCSKSRVAPLKPQTIPKLELCAAALLAELMREVVQLKPLEGRYFCWTDSTIVLSWLWEDARKFNVFVSNCVSTIQEQTAGMERRHVPTGCNPADIISRGALPSELAHSALWMHGPSFLSDDNSNWPDSCVPVKILPELRKSALAITSPHLDLIQQCKYVNSFSTMQRIFAYIHKFRTRNKSPGISLENIQHGTLILIRGMQRSHLWPEYKALQSKRPIKPSNQLSALSPFLDESRLIRVGGRLQNSTLGFEARHPIIIPKRHSLSIAIIRYYHEKNLHVGPQALLAKLRQQYWPLGGCKFVSSVLNKCVKCIRVKPRLLEHIMADLPKERADASRTFIVTGVDYCGPFYYKVEARNKRPVKCYLSLFICFATKAVHLELVKDLSTPGFLDALKRFIFTRGKPRRLWSDNATNFVGARNELLELRCLASSEEHQKAVHQFCLSEHIDWQFIPPRSPHFGGLWEAAVKTAKHHLIRTVGTSILDFDQLRTLVCQICAVINSRPLTPISENPADLDVLTPGHFLIGAPVSSVIEPDITQPNCNRLDRWQRVTFLQQIVWKRWSEEYLNLLQQRAKWRTPQPGIQINDVVLMRDESLPSLKWPLARVLELITGADGVARVAILRTATGTTRRAINKLCLLPTKDDLKA